MAATAAEARKKVESMNVLIIGGTGFIGAEVARQLRGGGHAVTLYHRSPGADLPYRQFQGDRDDAGRLSECLAETNPDCVLHTCAMNKGSIETLVAALAGKTARSVVISSADVYKAFEVVNKLSDAPVQPVPLTETSPLRDVRNFLSGYEKIDVEAAAKKLNAAVARLGMIYGRNDPRKRFADVVDAMRPSHGFNAPTPPLSIPLTVPRQVAAWRACYGGVRNAANGIKLLIERGKPGEIYNMADEASFTELEYREIIARLLNWRGEIVMTNEMPDAFNYEQDLTLDTSKIRRELGYRDIYTIDEELMELL